MADCYRFSFLSHAVACLTRAFLTGTDRITATVAQMHICQHAIHSETKQNGDDYLKDSHLMRPRDPE